MKKTLRNLIEFFIVIFGIFKFTQYTMPILLNWIAGQLGRSNPWANLLFLFLILGLYANFVLFLFGGLGFWLLQKINTKNLTKFLIAILFLTSGFFWVNIKPAQAVGIAFQDAAHFNISGSGSACQSYTEGAGSNPVMVMDFEVSDSAFDATLTSVTWNSVTMTQVNKNQLGGFLFWEYMYILPAAATGTHNLCVNWSGGGSQSPQGDIGTYTGASQTCKADATNTLSQTGVTTATITTTTVNDNDWVIAFFRSVSTLTASTNTTSRTTGWSNGGIFGDTNAVVHPAGNVSQSVTLSAGNVTMISTAIAPSTVTCGGGGSTIKSVFLNF